MGEEADGAADGAADGSLLAPTGNSTSPYGAGETDAERLFPLASKRWADGTGCRVSASPPTTGAGSSRLARSGLRIASSGSRPPALTGVDEFGTDREGHRTGQDRTGQDKSQKWEPAVARS
ncbi:hypothetical protein AK830_g11151 [Neonectria ditissima]|uniref:Uncharacterized protein n=1 Tax=Neonectria ditissima TaxID=78410 RepID=A0A0P7AN65_9HYPO|nr:hypothetical protein AK830_g11151 [Neonectria ditissima]